MSYCGHVLIANGDALEKDIIVGCMSEEYRRVQPDDTGCH